MKWVVFALLALLVRIGAIEGERSCLCPGIGLEYSSKEFSISVFQVVGF